MNKFSALAVAMTLVLAACGGNVDPSGVYEYKNTNSDGSVSEEKYTLSKFDKEKIKLEYEISGTSQTGSVVKTDGVKIYAPDSANSNKFCSEEVSFRLNCFEYDAKQGIRFSGESEFNPRVK